MNAEVAATETPERRRRTAELVERARRAHRPRMSMREAARRAGISESWYRRITDTSPEEGPSAARDETWLAIAEAVDLDAVELFGTLGRPLPDGPEMHETDGPEEGREPDQAHADALPEFENEAEQQVWELPLPAAERAHHIAIVRTRRETAQLRAELGEERARVADLESQIAELRQRLRRDTD